jgi:predicted ABC-type ATPase
LGYRVVLYFIWLRSAEMAIERVAGRVQQGGHYIYEDVVRRRYDRRMRNLFELYAPIVSNVYVFDGTAFPPILVAQIEGENSHVLDYTRWQDIVRKKRTLPMIRHNDPNSLGAKAELAFEDAGRSSPGIGSESRKAGR